MNIIKNLSRIVGFAFSFVAFVMSPYSASAQGVSGDKAIDRYAERQAMPFRFIYPFVHNPSMAAKRCDSSLSSIVVSYDAHNNDDSGLYQYGRGYNHVRLDATSFQKNDSHQLWGRAYYQRGVKKSIKWMSSSDWSEIYPYFTADTVGGNVKSEVYYFSGGINRNTWKGGSIGVQASYRALHEYRDIDPRPRNVVSDFKSSVGLSQLISDMYLVSISGRYDVYKQRGYKVEFANELGGVQQMSMKGLGEITKRFSGANGSLYYRKSGYGGTIEFAPKERSGVYGSLGFMKHQLERVITENNHAPTNKYLQNTITASVGYLQERSQHFSWGVANHYAYSHKKGFDNIIGDDGSGELLVLETQPIFYQQKWEDKVTVSQEQYWTRGIKFQTDLSAYASEEHIANVYPEEKVHLTRIGGAVSGTVSKRWKRSLLTVNVGADYNANIDGAFDYDRDRYTKRKDWNKPNPDEYISDYLDHTFAFLQSNKLKLNVTPTYAVELGQDYAVPLVFSISANYLYTTNQVRYKAHTAVISFGLAF